MPDVPDSKCKKCKQAPCTQECTVRQNRESKITGMCNTCFEPVKVKGKGTRADKIVKDYRYKMISYRCERCGGLPQQFQEYQKLPCRTLYTDVVEARKELKAKKKEEKEKGGKS